MKKFTITIDGKEIEMKKISVNEWIEMAKIYDKISESDNTNVEYIEARCKMVSILFGLTEEQIHEMLAEDIMTLYYSGTKTFQDMLASKMYEKKIDTENPITEN